MNPKSKYPKSKYPKSKYPKSKYESISKKGSSPCPEWGINERR